MFDALRRGRLLFPSKEFNHRRRDRGGSLRFTEKRCGAQFAISLSLSLSLGLLFFSNLCPFSNTGSAVPNSPTRSSPNVRPPTNPPGGTLESRQRGSLRGGRRCGTGDGGGAMSGENETRRMHHWPRGTSIGRHVRPLRNVPAPFSCLSPSESPDGRAGGRAAETRKRDWSSILTSL